MSHNLSRWWLLSILIAAAILRLVLAVVLPYDGGPDERRRYEVAKQIFATGRAPSYGSEGGPAYVVRPQFGLRINAWVAHLVPGDLPLFKKLRFGGVAVGILTVALVWAIARNLWPSRPQLAVAMTAAAAFYPELVFLHSYLNTDAYTIFASTLVFSMLSVVHRQAGLRPATAVALGSGLGLVFLGRENGYAAFILATGYLLYVWRKNWRQTSRILAITFAVFLLFPTAFYVHQYLVYGKAFIPFIVGSGVSWVPPGMTVSQAYAQLATQDYDYLVVHMDWLNAVHWLALLPWLFLGSLGVFGYNDILLPPLVYSWFLLLILLSLVGMVDAIRGQRRRADATDASRRWLLGSAAVAVVALLVAVMYHNFRIVAQPQGRYLMPIIIPAIVFLILGWRQLQRRGGLGVIVFSLGTGFLVVSGAYATWLLTYLYA